MNEKDFHGPRGTFTITVKTESVRALALNIKRNIKRNYLCDMVLDMAKVKRKRRPFLTPGKYFS